MDTGDRLRHLGIRALMRGNAWLERVRTGAAFDPGSREHLRDPYPAYRRLRERDPIHRSALAPGWVLSRHEDVVAVLRDPAFSADERNWSRYAGMQRRLAKRGMPDPYEEGLASMLRLDPPDHTRLRTLVSKAFTPRAVERMRPRVEALVKELLAGVEGEVDLVARFAAPLPVIVIAEMLGVPSEDHARFRHWSDEIVRTLGEASFDDVRRSLAARRELRAYFERIAAERRREPRGDLVSGLVAAEEAGDRLAMDELFGILVLLLVAGNETTTNLISNAVLALLEHPDQLERLRAEPALVPGAVEELLRYDSPVQLTSRIAREDGELRGRPVRRGEQLVLLLASANRDEAVFEHADRVDVGRANVRHLSFSQGIHFCLGAQLARLEGAVALSGLLEHFPRIERADGPVEWGDNSILRGPRRLPLRLAR